MKRALFILLGLGFCLMVILLSCSIDDDLSQEEYCENQLAYLSELKTQIEDYAATSVCSGTESCRYVAFGAKPCGGPWSFLVYSTSIDTLELLDMVDAYNTLEAQINSDCGLVSDCSVPLPPTGFDCIDNVCVPIY